jgi:hypothetical protein
MALYPRRQNSSSTCIRKEVCSLYDHDVVVVVVVVVVIVVVVVVKRYSYPCKRPWRPMGL